LTYWFILLVEETLRDIVEEKFEVKTDSCVYNPITDESEWDEARGCWYAAVFLLTDGREIEVDFKPTKDPAYGNFYVDPLEIKPRNVKLAEIRRPLMAGIPFTLENKLEATFHYVNNAGNPNNYEAKITRLMVDVTVENEKISVIYRQMPHYVILRTLRFDLHKDLNLAEAFVYEKKLYRWDGTTAKAFITSITKKMKPTIAALMTTPETVTEP
jgi:hypothetical protein